MENDVQHAYYILKTPDITHFGIIYRDLKNAHGVTCLHVNIGCWVFTIPTGKNNLFTQVFQSSYSIALREWNTDVGYMYVEFSVLIIDTRKLDLQK